MSDWTKVDDGIFHDFHSSWIIHLYVEHLTIGDPLIDMPLFLDSDFYVDIPLEATYQAA